MKKEVNKSLNMLTIGSIVMDILFIILGIFLVINPELSTKVSSVLLGIILIVSGLYAIVKFILNMNTTFIFTFELIYGILSILAGIMIMNNPFSLANIITVIVGFWLIISATFKATLAFRMRFFKEETWIINLSIAILTIVLGILLLVNPFNGYIVLSTYAGIMLLIYAGLDIVEQLLLRKRANEIEKIIF